MNFHTQCFGDTVCTDYSLHAYRSTYNLAMLAFVERKSLAQFVSLANIFSIWCFYLILVLFSISKHWQWLTLVGNVIDEIFRIIEIRFVHILGLVVGFFLSHNSLVSIYFTSSKLAQIVELLIYRTDRGHKMIEIRF